MNRTTRETGSVMVLALLVTMIILGVGLTVMWVSSSGMKISGNITRRHEALYAAESGIERARAVLTSELDWQSLLTGCTDSVTSEPPEDDSHKGNILCITGPSKLKNVRVIANSTATETALTGTVGQSLRENTRYTVWIRNDWQAECDTSKKSASKVQCDDDASGGSTSKSKAMFEDNNRRVIIRSEGLGRDGVSYVALEVILTGATGGSTSGDYNQIGLNAQGTHSAKGSVQ